MKVHVREGCNKLKKCDYCHATGHVKDECFKLIGYPENWNGKKKVNATVVGAGHLQQGIHDQQQSLKRVNTVLGEQLLTQDQLVHLMNKATPD